MGKQHLGYPNMDYVPPVLKENDTTQVVRFNKPPMWLKKKRKGKKANEKNPQTTLWSIFIMPQIKASSSERGPCNLFIFYSQQFHSENGGSWLWYYSVYGWLNSQKWSVGDKVGLENREVRNAGENGSGWGVDGLSMKVSRETFIRIPIWEKKNRWKECTDALHDKIAVHSQTRGMHTSSA